MEPVSEKNNFMYLTVGIVLLLFISALVDQFPGPLGTHLVQAFSVINIAIGIYGFKTSYKFFGTSITLVLAVAVIVFLSVILEELKLYYLHLFILFIFMYGLSTWQ